MSPLLYRLGYATTNKQNITWRKNCVNSNFSKNAFFLSGGGNFFTGARLQCENACIWFFSEFCWLSQYFCLKTICVHGNIFFIYKLLGSFVFFRRTGFDTFFFLWLHGAFVARSLLSHEPLLHIGENRNGRKIQRKCSSCY